MLPTLHQPALATILFISLGTISDTVVDERLRPPTANSAQSSLHPIFCSRTPKSIPFHLQSQIDALKKQIDALQEQVKALLTIKELGRSSGCRGIASRVFCETPGLLARLRGCNYVETRLSVSILFCCVGRLAGQRPCGSGAFAARSPTLCLTSSPAEIRLWLTEPLEPGYSDRRFTA